jgi:hypothetical protein
MEHDWRDDHIVQLEAQVAELMAWVIQLEDQLRWKSKDCPPPPPAGSRRSGPARSYVANERRQSERLHRRASQSRRTPR